MPNIFRELQVTQISKRWNSDFLGWNFKAHHPVDSKVGLPERKTGLKTIVKNRVDLVPGKLIARVIPGVDPVKVWSGIRDVVVGIPADVGRPQVPVSQRSLLQEKLVVDPLVGEGFIEPTNPETIPGEGIRWKACIQMVARTRETVNRCGEEGQRRGYSSPPPAWSETLA